MMYQDQARNPLKPIKPSQVATLAITPVGHIDDSPSALLALVDIQIAGMLTIRECRLMQPPDRPLYLSPPQRSWLEPETGKRRYTTLINFPGTWRAAIQEAARSAWDAHQQAQQLAAQQQTRDREAQRLLAWTEGGAA